MKNQIWIILLAIALAGSIWYNYDQAKENSALQESKDIVDWKLQDMQERNFRIIDSLEKADYDINQNVGLEKSKIQDLEEQIKNLRNGKYEKAVNNMRDPDSIRELFSRYYRDNTRSGEGSD